MEPGVQDPESGVSALLAGVEAAVRRGDFERRHEVLLEWAVERFRLERPEAEAVYALAEEEHLEPELGLLLVASGVGVVELEELETDPEGLAGQQAPPDWVTEGDITVPEARRERRLRLSFRRLRALLEETGSAADAVRRLATEPDVAEGAY